MNPSASPRGRGDRVLCSSSSGRHAEPLEDEGYKFQQEDGVRPAHTAPPLPSPPTRAALLTCFSPIFVALPGETCSKSQTTGAKGKIFERQRVSFGLICTDGNAL